MEVIRVLSMYWADTGLRCIDSLVLLDSGEGSVLLLSCTGTSQQGDSVVVELPFVELSCSVLGDLIEWARCDDVFAEALQLLVAGELNPLVVKIVEPHEVTYE
jgi:hypothetical protein